MSKNLVDGYPLQGAPVGKKLQVDIGGTKLSVTGSDITACTDYNLAWLEGSIMFASTMGKSSQDVYKATKDYDIPGVQFQDHKSFADSKVKKVTLKWTSELNDGEPAIDISLDDCMINYRQGVVSFRSQKGTGKYKDSAIIDFDGTDDSKQTEAGDSVSFEAQHS
ncbi:MAG: hypothetical protein GY756_14240 [bacterium]|nr:hypothetical protein [bacterium]